MSTPDPEKKSGISTPILVAIIGGAFSLLAILLNYVLVKPNHTVEQPKIAAIADSPVLNPLDSNFAISLVTVLRAIPDNFESLKGAPCKNFDNNNPCYESKVLINDPFTKTLIISRLKNWQFIFSLSGDANKEEEIFKKYDRIIQNVLGKSNPVRSTFFWGKGDNLFLESSKYNWSNRSIEFNRGTSKGLIRDEIIITNLLNTELKN